MRGKYLLGNDKSYKEVNIFADRSSLILEWILLEGILKNYFSMREVFRNTSVSLGLVQKVFTHLVRNGFLKSEGIRTSKTYSLVKPKILLKKWMDHYSITKKCRMWSYSSPYNGRDKIQEAIIQSNQKLRVVKALHSAASAMNCKHTNLDTLELYMIEPSQKKLIEEVLHLEHKERGYEILLIEPYYKEMIKRSISNLNGGNEIPHTHALLTFLDLFHFPLRGVEQAEYLAKKIDRIKKIYD